MSIPAGVARISLNGHLGASEIFDTSFWVTTEATIDPTWMQELADGVAGVLTAANAMQATRYLIHATDGYDTVTCYGYPAGGPTASYSAQANLNLAGNGAQAAPFQTSIVVSLRTAQIGRSRRGRMFLPATALGLATTGLWTSGTFQAPALAAEWAAIFHAVNGLVLGTGAGATSAVVSQTLTSAFPIESVVVDNRPDIQRRRANSLQPSVVSTVNLV